MAQKRLDIPFYNKQILHHYIEYVHLQYSYIFSFNNRQITTQMQRWFCYSHNTLQSTKPSGSNPALITGWLMANPNMGLSGV